jgi:hypothetical protein
MMGCTEVTEEVLLSLNAPEIAPEECGQSAVRLLSLVACKGLRSCWLGLSPMEPSDLALQQGLLMRGPHANVSASSCSAASWREVPCLLAGIFMFGFFCPPMPVCQTWLLHTWSALEAPPWLSPPPHVFFWCGRCIEFKRILSLRVSLFFSLDLLSRSSLPGTLHFVLSMWTKHGVLSILLSVCPFRK